MNPNKPTVIPWTQLPDNDLWFDQGMRAAKCIDCKYHIVTYSFVFLSCRHCWMKRGYRGEPMWISGHMRKKKWTTPAWCPLVETQEITARKAQKKENN